MEGKKEVQSQGFRHELKHLINFREYYELKNRLKYTIKTDPFTCEDGKYKIRSLYFDNFNNDVLMEKIDGVDKREKFRIRYYNYDPTVIKMEKKSKINGLCLKRSENISKTECQMLIDGYNEWMLESGSKLLKELYCKIRQQLLKPKTIVDYTREAYYYDAGNVRICIDSEIKSGLFSLDFFNPDLPTVSILPYGIMLLEVKYNNYFPNVIGNILNINTRRNISFSKYAACREGYQQF